MVSALGARFRVDAAQAERVARVLAVRFTHDWLRQHPLTQVDLKQEADWLRAADLRLDFG